MSVFSLPPKTRFRLSKQVLLRLILLIAILVVTSSLAFYASHRWRAQNRSLNDGQRAAAEKTFSEAHRLQLEGKAEFLREAVKKYEEVLIQWRSFGASREEALTLRYIGEIHQLLGAPQSALRYYEQALDLAKKSNDPRGQAEALNNLGFVYLSLGNNQLSLETCSQALKISQEAHYSSAEAQAFNNLGEYYYYSGNLQKALEFYQQASSLYTSLNDRRGQAQTLMYFGYSYSDLGEPEKAFGSYRQALSLWQNLDDLRGQAKMLTAIGKLHSRLGESQEALDYLNQAMPLAKALADQIEQARILIGIGYVYFNLGEKKQAIYYYEQALELFKAASHLPGEGETHHSIGRAYFSLNNLRQALEHYQLFLSINQKRSDKRMISYALRDIGTVYEAEGNRTKALEYYNSSLPFYRTEKDRRGEAFTLNLIGHLSYESGKRRQALAFFNRALPLNQISGDRIGKAITLYNLALAERSIGHLIEARSHIETSLKVVESLRTKVASQDLRASYLASVYENYDLYIDLLMQMHKQRPSQGLDLEALRASELSRARTLIELLAESHANVRRGGDPELIERSRKLQQEINVKAERKVKLLNSGASQEEIIALGKAIDTLIAEQRQVEAQLQLKSPHYADLIQPKPSDLKEIQQLLDENTLLLEYSLGSERSYLWAVTPTGIRSYVLPKRAEIEKLARPVYELISGARLKPGQDQKRLEIEYRERSTKLGESILRPVADQLGKKRLLIVADGILQYIPFQALPDPGVVKPGLKQSRVSETINLNSSQPLMIEHEIINLPSASTLAVLRRETARRKPASKIIAALVDPVFQEDDLRLLRAMGKLIDAANLQIASNNFPEHYPASGQTRDGSNYRRLYLTKEEADVIEAYTKPSERLIAMGFDASRARAISPELSQYRIIHFGTHGILDTDNPELSAIVLSFFDQKGQKQDGLLRLQDIYNLNLPADLVVLSACETALGKEIKGEGLIGLTRGFMYAGAARVMASLWKVEDRSTAELMRHFYTFLLRDKMPPAEALRRAQIEVWKQPDYRSPYHWAGFVLQGEYR